MINLKCRFLHEVFLEGRKALLFRGEGGTGNIGRGSQNELGSSLQSRPGSSLSGVKSMGPQVALSFMAPQHSLGSHHSQEGKTPLLALIF